MENPDSKEAADKSVNQNDPTVMYLIVRESLEMSIGKTAAQCAHAAQMLQLKYNELIQEDMCGWGKSPDIKIFNEWLEESFRKVVLRADDKEWLKLKAELHNHVLVVDAGLTEIASGSETVIGLWPMRKSQVSKTVKRLQVLK